MKHNPLFLAAHIFLLVFLLVSLLPAARPFWPEQAAPVLIEALQYKRPLPAWWTEAALALHPGNATIMRRLAEYEKGRGNAISASLLLERAIVLDPKNLELIAAYNEMKNHEGKPLSYIDQVTMMSRAYLGYNKYGRVGAGIKRYPPQTEAIIGPGRLAIKNILPDQVTAVLARSFYLFGASIRDKSPEGALYWWQLAADTDRGVSYYFVAAASLQTTVFKDTEGAKNTLVECAKNEDARFGCEKALHREWVPPLTYYDPFIVPLIPLSQQ